MKQKRRWGISRAKNPYKRYHLATNGSGSRSLCGSVVEVEVADHPLGRGDRRCGACEAALDPAALRLGAHYEMMTQALAGIFAAFAPTWRLRRADAAEMIVSFLAARFHYGPDHPQHEAFVDQVRAFVAREWAEDEGYVEPRFTEVERRWLVRQSARRRQPPHQATRAERAAERAAERKAVAAKADRASWTRSLACARCERLPDDCECDPLDEELELPGRRECG